jgi:hypothetical protein
LKMKKGVQLQSHLLVTELPHTRTESSWNWALDHTVQQDGATAHTVRDPWRSFRSTLLHCAASFHSLHVRLIPLPLEMPQRKCTPLDHGPWWPQDSNSEANFSDTRKHGETSTGKLRASLEERVRSDGQHLSDVLFKTK